MTHLSAMKGRWTVSRILAASGTLTVIAGGVGAMVATALDAALPTWVFAALFGVGMLDVFLSRVFKRIEDRRGFGAAVPPVPISSVTAVDPYTPSAEGVRLEQLKTITGLRDSGALSPKEFEAEKRRILKGDGV